MSTKKIILLAFVGGIVGSVLTLMGYGIETYQYWLVMLALSIVIVSL